MGGRGGNAGRGPEQSQGTDILQKVGRGLVPVKPPGLANWHLLKLGSCPPQRAGDRGSILRYGWNSQFLRQP